MTVKYYTFSAPKVGNTDGVLGGVDQKNPIFNFSPDFFPKMRSVSQVDLAQSVL